MTQTTKPSNRLPDDAAVDSFVEALAKHYQLPVYILLGETPGGEEIAAGQWRRWESAVPRPELRESDREAMKKLSDAIEARDAEGFGALAEGLRSEGD